MYEILFSITGVAIIGNYENYSYWIKFETKCQSAKVLLFALIVVFFFSKIIY